MKTMLWKELRENFKWALLALLALLVAEFFALAAGRKDSQNSYNELTLCTSAFLLVTSFGYSAVGAALGVVQILPELRRDQWAALLHRPVSRGVIFLGKVLAGLLLYFFATLPPFLASAAYVATPGQFASPLVPGMLLPGLSDIFLGLVSYFGALLICLQPGRWLGRRGVIGLAVVLVFLAHAASAFPFLLPLLVASMFLLAGWGAILSSGRLQDRPWVARLSLLIIVLMGAQAALVLVLDGLRFLPNPGPVSISGNTEFSITRDGQVFLLSQRGPDARQVLTDMNGKVVTDERYVGNRNYQNFLQLQLLAFGMDGQGRMLLDDYLKAHPRNLQNYVVLMSGVYGNKEEWFKLVRQNYFIGYDKLSRRCVGICDVDGFKKPGASPRAFPIRIIDSEWFFSAPHLFWSGPQLYFIDPAERKLGAPLNAGKGLIYGATALMDTASRDQADLLAVALDGGVRVIDVQGRRILDIPYNHDLRKCPILSIGINSRIGRYYVQYAPDFFGQFPVSPSAGRATILDEIDAKGNVLHTYSRDLNNTVEQPPDWISRLTTYTLPLLPVLVTGAYHAVVPPVGSFNEDASLAANYDSTFKGLDVVVIIAVAALLSVLTFSWARRVGFSGKRARLWAVFVFCFGLPGLLTFRLVSAWPVRVRCPRCGGKRAVEAETCPHCHAPWNAPQSTGVEIFDLEPLVHGAMYSSHD